MPAPIKDLGDLHTLVCNALTTELGKDRGGEDIPAALLAQAINFLKANGIEALPVEGAPLQSLVKELPFTTHEDMPH